MLHSAKSRQLQVAFCNVFILVISRLQKFTQFLMDFLLQKIFKSIQIFILNKVMQNIG